MALRIHWKSSIVRISNVKRDQYIPIFISVRFQFGYFLMLLAKTMENTYIENINDIFTTLCIQHKSFFPYEIFYLFLQKPNLRVVVSARTAKPNLCRTLDTFHTKKISFGYKSIFVTILQKAARFEIMYTSFFSCITVVSDHKGFSTDSGGIMEGMWVIGCKRGN